MAEKFDPNAPRSDFGPNGYPTCRVFNPLTGEAYNADMPETQKVMRGVIPALAPVMALQAAEESAAYAVEVFFPSACSANKASDVADVALDAFMKSFDPAARKELLALEFGVGTGGTTRYIGNKLETTPLYAFDWFHGLTEDWTDFQKKGRWTQNGNEPQNLPSNVTIINGKFQDTLTDFLASHEGKSVGFVHMDADTYESTKYVLDAIVPLMCNGAVILFDDYFNFPGWSKPGLGEASAWHDTVKRFHLTVEPACFALEHQSTAWQILKNPFHEKTTITPETPHTRLPDIQNFMTSRRFRTFEL
jgi:hypothetical protein